MMTQHHEDDLLRLQHSVFFYREEVPADDEQPGAPPDYSEQLYPHMLAEDVINQIMPSRRFAHAGAARTTLEPADAGLERLVATALERPRFQGYLSSRLDDAVHHFLRECAYTIMSFGEAAYEIVALVASSSAKASREWRGFVLQAIPPRTLRHEGKRLIQMIPAAIAQTRGVAQRVELPSDLVLLFEPPAYVRSSFRSMLGALAAADVTTQFNLYMQATRDEQDAIPYEFGTHVQTEAAALAEATRTIGWYARGLFAEHVSEYYLADRRLRFEQFIIELRSAILDTLNDGLARVDASLALTGRVKVDGGPTIADVTAARQRLQSGEQSPAAIVKQFSSV